MNRFNIALAEVDNAEPRMVLTYLMRAIDKSSEFGKWLKMEEPNSLDKFYKKADAWRASKHRLRWYQQKPETMVLLRTRNNLTLRKGEMMVERNRETLRKAVLSISHP